MGRRVKVKLPPLRTRLRKGDKVRVIAGKDRGKEGTVISVLYKKHRVIVEDVNVIKKHQKPVGASEGGIIKKEAPIHISNVMFVCPHCNEPTRIGVRFLEDGKKVRVCKKCGEDI